MYRNATDFEVNTSSISSIHKVPVPPPSALSMAKSITNFDEISYPEGIQSPDPNLNRNASLLRYDRPFLLQFMEVCKEKPEGLLDLVTMGFEPDSAHGQEPLSMSRGGSGRHKGSSSVALRPGSIGLGIKSGQSMFPSMGNIGSGSKLTSDDRFAASNRAVSVGGNTYGGTSMQTNRMRSERDEKRGEGNKSGRDGYGHGQSDASHGLSVEPVVLLEVSANRWNRNMIGAKDDKFALVDRRVKALLNKLSTEKFDSISDQIIEWVNESEDCKTLMQVIALVFDMALDEATSEIYARLCRKMMEKLSPTVRDESITLQDGKPIAGGQLFRKYLLNRCQEEFEHGWAVKQSTAVAAAKKAAEDQAVRAANEKEGNTEVALYSDEYYAAQKAKRRGLGLIKFIGELFKLQMLTERIMHTFLKKLLNNVEEEDLESCCKLLMTIGSMLDTTKAANHMMAYFLRITELSNSTLVSPRVQFMLQDVLDLREKKWISRNVAAGNAPRPPSKAGDLSNSSKINKNTSMSFGPNTVFSEKGGDNKRKSVSLSSMFSMLSQGDASPAESHAPEPQRKRLVLPPRTKPTADKAAAKSESETKSEAETSSPVEITKEFAIKITKDMEEFFAVRNLDKAEMYLTNLPVIHHFRLVHKFTSRAIQAEKAEVQLLAELFNRAVEKDLISSDAFEAGFLPVAATIHDVTINAPRAFRYFAIVVKSAGLDYKRKARLASRIR